MQPKSPSSLSGSLFLLESAAHADPEPSTRAGMAAVNALAAAYRGTGRAEDALVLLEKLAARASAVLGADDPDTLIVRGNLAVTMAQLEQPTALAALDAAVADRTRAFGALHPLTLTARDAMAVALRLDGQAERACELHREIVLDRARVLGGSHPDTLLSRMGAALAHADAGDVDESVRMLEAAVDDAANTAGQPHPILPALQINLALSLADAGRGRQGVDLLERAAADRTAAEGPHDETTIALREALSDLIDGGPAGSASMS